MPRRNLNVLIVVVLVALVCYREGSARRSHYGQMFQTLVDVLDEVDRHYVEPIDQRKLFEGALSGIANQLDEYSGYIKPRDYTALQEDLGEGFGGVGIQVVVDPQTRQLTVMSPLVGTPAYEAGILAGDTIVAIDGQSAENMTMQDAVELIRGPVGEEIRISVLHAGQTEPQEYRLRRAEIHVDTVLGDFRADDDSWNFFLEDHPQIGYIRLNAFSQQSTEELTAALEKLKQRGMSALILDLRNNPGGLLNSAVEICDLFIDQGTIVTTRGRDRKVQDNYQATRRGNFTDFPLVVLVNKYSASASEIVSACLQDHQRAVIVGERTWGKGSVQSIIPLEHGQSALKLTVSSYWRPSGKNIHRLSTAKDEDEWGVRPDPGFDAPMNAEQFKAWMEDRRERDVVRHGAAPPKSDDQPPSPRDQVDPQLQKAIEYLEQKLAAQVKAA